MYKRTVTVDSDVIEETRETLFTAMNCLRLLKEGANVNEVYNNIYDRLASNYDFLSIISKAPTNGHSKENVVLKNHVTDNVSITNEDYKPAVIEAVEGG